MSEQDIITLNTESSPAEMMKLVLSNGGSIEKLEKLLELQERWEVSRSKKAYAQDFAKAQSEIEPVVKRAVNPQTHSKYALLENINDVIKPVYTKYGFSVMFNEVDSPSAEYIRIIAYVKHNLGHTEEYRYDSPFECSGLKGNANMTKTHGKASAVSYARRYLLCMIFNISTTDTDGNPPAVESIDENKIDILNKIIESKGVDIKKFLAYMKVEKIEDIKSSDFARAKMSLESAKGAK